jgi:hypothetical protein
MLLELPSNFRKPSNEDAGIEIELICDWIEASVLFAGESICAPTIADLLLESEWFGSQNESRGFVDEVWSRLKARHQELGNKGPFSFSYQTIELSIDDWTHSPAHAFCLLLCFGYHHENWGKKIGWNYNVQGELFEKMTCSALKEILPLWTSYSTGWSAKTPTQLSTLVGEIAGRLCGQVKNLKRWNRRQAKEQGLDVLCYRSFSDQKGNFPAFFVQCASGKNISHKLSTPNLEVWNDLLQLVPTSLPRKGFATPLMFPRREFEQCAILGGGLILDRRLLSAQSHNESWLEASICKAITKWAKPIVKKLPWSE